MIGGYACDRCGALSAGRGECPGCGTAARPVPDLLEEMVQRTLDDDGRVTVIRDAPFSVAAKLRFPVTARRAPAWSPGRPGTNCPKVPSA